MVLLPPSTENTNVLSLHFSCPIFLLDFSRILDLLNRFSLTSPKNKFHENPSSGSRAETCGQTEGQTGMTMRTTTFRWFYERA